MAKATKQVNQLQQLQVQQVPLNRIRPNSYNPNRQTDEEFCLLVKSMEEDGFTQPIVVQADGEIVDGEHRWTAVIVRTHLRNNNLPLSDQNIVEARARRGEIIDPAATIPVVYVSMTEVQRRVATMRHNRARGTEDVQLLSGLMKEFEQLGAIDWAMDSLDMSDEEVERLLSYGDSILDHFPGDQPSPAWEPRQTLPGQVQSWSDPETHQAQSVSQAAATPIADYHPADSAVPGLGVHAPAVARSESQAPVPAPPVMARRIYVMLEEEAKIVDRALGPEAASTLVQICKEKLAQ